MSTRKPCSRRELAQQLHATAAPSAIVRSKCGMPPTTSTPMCERALQVVERAGAAQHAVLRKRDQLQVEIRRDAPLHFEQRLDREQARIADVDVRADREQPVRDGPVAILQRALDSASCVSSRLQFAPQRDAFEQRARRVHARQAVGQRRVHVEVRVDEGRRDERTVRVDFLARGGGQMRFDRDDAPRLRCRCRPGRGEGQAPRGE